MPVAALAASGLFALGRTASDDKARKEELRAAQRGLPPVPETDVERPSTALSSQTTDVEKEGSIRGSRDSYASSGHAATDDSKSFEVAERAASIDEGLPPPYSRDLVESPTSISQRSSDLTRTTSSTSRPKSVSASSGSSISDANTVRVRTKGHDLKSGFPYHPRLFDLRVRPDDWQRFSDQVTESTKFDRADYAKMWAAAGSVALTGSILTTAWVGRTINRSIQEKKVSTGLVDVSEGGLGYTLQQWNDSYFAPLGLCASLELSDSTMRKPKHKSSAIRKPSLLYSTREERDRKREDRKFVIVITGLDNLSPSTADVHELPVKSDRVELPVPEDPRGYKAELPGESGLKPSQLPTTDDLAKEDLANIICGVAELPADIPAELSADGSSEFKKSGPADHTLVADNSLLPPPLVVKGSEKAHPGKEADP